MVFERYVIYVKLTSGYIRAQDLTAVTCSGRLAGYEVVGWLNIPKNAYGNFGSLLDEINQNWKMDGVGHSDNVLMLEGHIDGSPPFLLTENNFNDLKDATEIIDGDVIDVICAIRAVVSETGEGNLSKISAINSHMVLKTARSLHARILELEKRL